MEITWEEIAYGYEMEVEFCEGYSDLYHALYRILAAGAGAYRDGLSLSVGQQAVIDVIEDAWAAREIAGWLEAALLTPAAIHAAILDGDPATDSIRQFYATVGGSFDLDYDFDALEAAVYDLFQNPGEILPAMLQELRVQTNEPSRGIGWLLPAYVFSAWEPNLTITIADLGTSSGLNLAADYQNWYWHLDSQALMRNHEPWLMEQTIHLEDAQDPDLLNLLPANLPNVPITNRVGFDRHPLHLENAYDRLSLRACIWGDQPERLARFDHAMSGYQRLIDAEGHPKLYQGDIIEAASLLPNIIPADVQPPHLLLVFNSAVTVYFPDNDYDRLRAALITALNELPDDVMGLWLEAESPRYNEAVDRDKHFLLKARIPFMGGISSFYLGEMEAHPMNLYVRPGWNTLRSMLNL